MRKPIKNIPTFFKTGAETTRARKVANIAKAIKEYIPEQGKSTAKAIGFPEEVVSAIVGGPYDGDSVTGKPTVFIKL